MTAVWVAQKTMKQSKKVMSVLADYVDHRCLPIRAVFVLRPCPNYKKPVLLRDTPTFFLAGQDGHPDMPFFKSSSLFEKTGGAYMMDGGRWSVKQYKEKEGLPYRQSPVS